MLFENFLKNLPEVEKPTEKRLPFNTRMKWTIIILVAYFALGLTPLYGLGSNSLQMFESLSIILGASFGSLISLGIGPIVTASIVLQLLVGANILDIDLTKDEGRAYFQGLQKITSIFFIFLEAIIYVYMGGLSAVPGPNHAALQIGLVIQLIIGGLLILFMDEVVAKWGFGSGISLFIVAGVSKSIMIRFLSPLTTAGTLGYPFGSGAPIGKLWDMIYALKMGNIQELGLAVASVLATLLVFVLVVYVQAMKVELPLTFERVRGYGIRWPLAFLYTSNIPVILVAALMANFQLWAKLLSSKGIYLLGKFQGNMPVSGLVYWTSVPSPVYDLIKGAFTIQTLWHTLAYITFLTLGSLLFSVLWVATSGIDAKSQAKQILASGLKIPGFRKDIRILERVLNRYIMPLAVMGGIAVGILASIADISGALSRGTGILLAVMILYQMYEQIAREHMMEMTPALRKFIK